MADSSDAESAFEVTVRFYAAARAAAQVDQETVTLTSPATVADVLTKISARHGPQLAHVLRRCSYLLDETAVHKMHAPVMKGDILDVLPPFAGG